MKYYSTRHNSLDVSLEEAVFKGLAPDGGLYLPRTIPRLPQAFLHNIRAMSLKDICYAIAYVAFHGDIEASVIHELVNNTFNYDIPITAIDNDKYVMELFHGPTMAFKDVGAMFMGSLLRHYIKQSGRFDAVNVLVATSGDTGAAVAGGLHNIPGVNVWILYPQDSISYMQEAQFATLGGNIRAVEVNGTLADCKAIVKQAFNDKELNERMLFSSATSINVARIVPQTFYYFWAYATLARKGVDVKNLVFSVPCGNLGNLASGLVARAMGLPIKRFVAAGNIDNALDIYLNTGQVKEATTFTSIAPAINVSSPTNFDRITALTGDLETARQLIHSYAFAEDDVMATMRELHDANDYVMDTHSAFAYRALQHDLQPGEVGVSLATAHPAKFSSQVEMALGHDIDVPQQLREYLSGTRQVETINSGYTAFKKLLLANQ